MQKKWNFRAPFKYYMMTKTILMMFLFSLIGMASYAQSFEKGNNGINLGVGLGSGYYYGIGVGFGVNASYEYGIVKVPMGSELTGVVGVGGIVGASFSSFGTGLLFAVRGSYHVIFHNKIDPYIAIALGYRGYAFSSTYSSGVYGDFGFSAVLGARYFFTKKIGVYTELGYMLNIFNLGLSIKL